MASGSSINIEWDLDRKRREEEERKKEGLKKITEWTDQGFTLPEAKAMYESYVKGNTRIPTERSVMLAPKDIQPNQDFMGFGGQGPSTREPIELGILENKVWNPVTQGYDIVRTRGKARTIGSPNLPKTPGSGVTHFIDATSGEEIRQEANKEGKDKYITINPTLGKGKGAGTLKDYQDDIAKEVLKNYFTLKATGQDTATIEPQAVGAAKRFGMDINQIENEPGFWGKLFGAEPTSVQEPQFTPKRPAASATTPAGAAPSSGKALTPDLAQVYLTKAGGNKDLARQMARRDGYKF